MAAGRQEDAVAVSSKQLTLTFDNGPTPGITERVLDILARRRPNSTVDVLLYLIILPDVLRT
jgi:peptidoglycan/xylan/chitin deacetylase (PgdA/CDA1 family)